MCNDPIYFLFAGDHYYPNGGMGDFKGFFQTVQDATNYAKDYDWWHVVNQSDTKIVLQKDFNK